MRHLGGVCGKGIEDTFVVMAWEFVQKRGQTVCGDPKEPGPLVMSWVPWDSPWRQR